jgi:lipid-A-disaccharide synthase
MDLLIAAAEPSGDRHAAHLLRALRGLRPALDFSGFGGPEMRAAGCELHADLTAMASMGLGFRKHLLGFVKVLERFDELLVKRRPAAVLLVDSPGLNFLLARLARWRGVPVAYYICPQIWAWAPWRRSKVLRWTDLLMVILPFEETLYRNPRVPVHYVGHPLADELSELPPSWGAELREALAIAPGEQLVGVFPGSRRHEVEGLLPHFRRLLERMELDPRRHRLAVSCYRPEFGALVEGALRGSPLRPLVFREDARRLMMACDLALLASGTATLELAFFEKPMLVFYRAGWIERLLYRLFVVSPAFALPNILGLAVNGDAEPTVVERLLGRELPADLPARARRLLEDGEARIEAIQRLQRLKESLFRPGGSALAARTLLDWLDGRGGREGLSRSGTQISQISENDVD